MRTLLPLLAVLLLGCPDDPDEVAATDFEGQLADDVEGLVALMMTVDDDVTALPDQVDAVQQQECYALLGDCERCFDYDGAQATGAWTSAPVFAEECKYSGADVLLAATFEITSEDLSGTWAGTPEEYVMTFAGEREATLSLNTPKFGLREYDVSYEINDANATTDDNDVDAFDVTLEYRAFHDQFWTAEIEGNEFSVRGTANGPGWTCDVEGTPSSTRVTCS